MCFIAALCQIYSTTGFYLLNGKGISTGAPAFNKKILKRKR